MIEVRPKNLDVYKKMLHLRSEASVIHKSDFTANFTESVPLRTLDLIPFIEIVMPPPYLLV